jgi:hypothetical protein
MPAGALRGRLASKLSEMAQGRGYPIRPLIKGSARSEEKKRHGSEAQKKAVKWNQQRGTNAFYLGNSARTN